MLFGELLSNTGFILVSSIVGILPVLAGFKPPVRWIDASLGFSGGVMIAVSFSMLYEGELSAYKLVFFTAGFAVMWLLEALIPHEHLVKGYEGPRVMKARLKIAWLIAFSMILHNVPEGLAVGSSTVRNPVLGFSVAVAIGVQDVVEGFMAGLPYVITGDRGRAFLLSLIAALAEALASLGAGFLGIVEAGALAPLTCFSSGAMVFIVSHEIIPETHREHSSESTAGFLLGVMAATVLELLL